MKQCHDEFPPAEPELSFISDADIRLGIEDRVHAAWTDFNACEWMGATVFASAALEALAAMGAEAHEARRDAQTATRRKAVISWPLTRTRARPESGTSAINNARLGGTAIWHDFSRWLVS
jgi:hypothetical protein